MTSKREGSITGLQIFAVGLIFFLICLALFLTYVSLEDKTDRGTFGDMFGVTNSIFSGMAFLGILIGVILQRNEIHDTKASAIAQAESFRLQQFETTFFNMVSLHHELVNGIQYKGKIGRKVFEDCKERLKDFASIEEVELWDSDGTQLRMHHFDRNIRSVEEVTALMEKEYLQRYALEFEPILNHYFRNLYHIFKFIHTSHYLVPKQKKFYAALIRAQLSQNELYAIMFNSMKLGYGNPKFLYLANEYKVLKNFRSSDVEPPIFFNSYEHMCEQVRNPF
ncbi:putative phage abortive infection protein [Paradesertivirga mongoliensis]|uniref:Phage abortive infection protein n=1 Tax=Paradesertivirga mongoliensis TaxID=2100740 RepID=A0ABW4ZMN1_9SPHI|nr:putative phage abortive infection protein [Pedobacter mongoliensis]